MQALESMRKGLASAQERRDYFRKLAERVESKKTRQDGDLWPALDPVDGKPWKASTLRRHQKACACGYEAMADYWNACATDLELAIEREKKRLEGP